jgi:ABC-type transporter Mla maintaining outer membrane lipid asymmetry ATPase subunit MlaF
LKFLAKDQSHFSLRLFAEKPVLDIRGGLMGMVFQEDSLFTGLPVYENAAYRLKEHGWPQGS